MKNLFPKKRTTRAETGLNHLSQSGSQHKHSRGKVLIQALMLGFASLALLQAALLTRPAATQPKQNPTQAQTLSAQTKSPANQPIFVTARAFQPLLGNYVGEIYPVDMDRPDSVVRKLNLVIEGIQDGKITGHSFISGQKQSFVGHLTPLEDGLFNVVAQEPASQEGGTFKLVLNAKSALGQWQPHSQTKAQPHKLELQHKVFSYNPAHALEAGIIPIGEVRYDENGDNIKQEGITEDAGKYNASKVKLTSEMVENMYLRDLELMRNAIYARHGQAFKDPLMHRIFEFYDWYIPVSQDVSAELTPLEKENIALIQRYEQHASKYYDHFGR